MALDNIIAVVDCARMRDEFEGGRALAESLRKEDDLAYLLVQQLGRQIQEKQSGPFLVAAPKEQQDMVLARFPEVRRNWDPVYGDRRIRLVFIGKNMDRAAIEAALEDC